MWAANTIIALLLVPTVAAFVLGYRHALRHWVSPGGTGLPVAAVAAQPRRRRAELVRGFHAAGIGLAVASLVAMAVMLGAMVTIMLVA
ncbi:MAG: hypothetical protein R3B06_29010 [Kofleriaceae bacterium]